VKQVGGTMAVDSKYKTTEYMGKVFGDLLKHRKRNEWHGDCIYLRKMSLREQQECRRFWDNGTN
jgi:hypothetical protein